MKFTKIKSLKGKPFNTQEIASELVQVLAEMGFFTEVKETKAAGFTLSVNGASFFINTEMLPINLRYAPNTPTGYKRTHIPTWKQRVAYNLKVQEFLNKKGLVCKVTSGSFLIKDHDRDYAETDWNTDDYNKSSNRGWSNIIEIYHGYEAEEREARKARRDAKKPIPSNAEKFILGIKKESKNGK